MKCIIWLEIEGCGSKKFWKSVFIQVHDVQVAAKLEFYYSKTFVVFFMIWCMVYTLYIFFLVFLSTLDESCGIRILLILSRFSNWCWMSCFMVLWIHGADWALLIARSLVVQRLGHSHTSFQQDVGFLSEADFLTREKPSETFHHYKQFFVTRYSCITSLFFTLHIGYSYFLNY